MVPGEIFLANFPFGDSAGMKLRPVLLLTGPLGSVPEVLVAYISSVVPPVLLTTDIALDPADPQQATVRLKQKSVLRLHKLATIHESSLVRQLGRLSPALQSDVKHRLRFMLHLQIAWPEADHRKSLRGSGGSKLPGRVSRNALVLRQRVDGGWSVAGNLRRGATKRRRRVTPQLAFQLVFQALAEHPRVPADGQTRRAVYIWTQPQ